MKIFRRILLIILCIALVVISIGFILPRKIHVERSLLLNASQKTVFNQVNILKNWVKWSPWLQMDTNLRLIYTGPESGVGAKVKWMSSDKSVGSGNVSIVSSVLPDSVEVVFDFAEKGKSTGKYLFRKENNGTNVTSSLESDLGLNPMSRWIGLFSDHLIGPDIEQGLFNLNNLVQDTKTLYGYEIMDYLVPSGIVISARDTASPETVATKLAMMYKKISLFLKSKGLSPIGNPLAVFHYYSSRGFDIEAGLPIPSIVIVPEGLICSEKAAQRTVKIKYFGSYEMISSAYVALQTYIDNNDLQKSGPGWEEYITNPTIEADSDKRQTNIYYPIK
jgi:effector-binding domain-containing protein